MLNALQTILALAESSPGFDDPNNRAEFERAKPLVLGAHRILMAAQLMLERWGQGNLTQQVQMLAAAVRAASAPGEFPRPENVLKYLDLSMEHLDDESKSALEDYRTDLTVTEMPHGWWIFVPEINMVDEDRLPWVLKRIIDRARTLGCCHIMLDHEAGYDSELPTYSAPGEEDEPGEDPAVPVLLVKAKGIEHLGMRLLIEQGQAVLAKDPQVTAIEMVVSRGEAGGGGQMAAAPRLSIHYHRAPAGGLLMGARSCIAATDIVNSPAVAEMLVMERCDHGNDLLQLLPAHRDVTLVIDRQGLLALGTIPGPNHFVVALEDGVIPDVTLSEIAARIPNMDEGRVV